MDLFININNNILKVLTEITKNNDLEKAISLFADIPIFFLPLFLVISWLYYSYFLNDNSNKKNLLYIFLATIIWIIINLIIQQFFYEDRPFIIVDVILTHLPNNSFPSDHATVSFSFITSLYLSWYRKIFLFFFPVVLIMNFSRLAWWIHWFFDVITGMIIGIVSWILVFKILKKDRQIDNYIVRVMNFCDRILYSIYMKK